MNYYVNRVAQSNGDHEVHTETCAWLPSIEHRLYLGTFYACGSAVIEAQKYFYQSNGCYYCSYTCHTS
ncbi:hypothetical protein D9M68_896200 [compost metagenome]